MHAVYPTNTAPITIRTSVTGPFLSVRQNVEQIYTGTPINESDHHTPAEPQFILQ